MHDLYLIFLAVYLVGVGIYRFFRWIGRSLNGTSARPSARPASGRLPPVGAPRAPEVNFGAPAGQSAPRPAAPRPTTQRPARRADSSPRESSDAAEAQYRRVSQIEQEEVKGLNTPLTSSSPARVRKMAALLGSRNDVLRAIILQEVLAPPLSKRRRAPSPTSKAHE